MNVGMAAYKFRGLSSQLLNNLCENLESVGHDSQNAVHSKWLYLLPLEHAFLRARTSVVPGIFRMLHPRVMNFSPSSGLTITAAPMPSAFLLSILWMPCLI